MKKKYIQYNNCISIIFDYFTWNTRILNTNFKEKNYKHVYYNAIFVIEVYLFFFRHQIANLSLKLVIQ